MSGACDRRTEPQGSLISRPRWMIHPCEGAVRHQTTMRRGLTTLSALSNQQLMLRIPWSRGAVEPWSRGAVEPWSRGAVEPWSRARNASQSDAGRRGGRESGRLHQRLFYPPLLNPTRIFFRTGAPARARHSFLTHYFPHFSASLGIQSTRKRERVRLLCFPHRGHRNSRATGASHHA
jgi:hypothetical protein